MNQLQATAKIQQLRRRWRSTDSDLGIARRAKRVYLALGGMYLCMASVFNLLHRDSSQSARIVGSVGFLIGAVFFYWRSWRFGRIARSLADPDTP
jgi:hypothetical protein